MVCDVTDYLWLVDEMMDDGWIMDAIMEICNLKTNVTHLQAFSRPITNTRCFEE